MLLITGILFFSLVLFSDAVEPTLKALGLTPLMAAVLVGAAQNVFSKSSKYSLFDPCKEMAYIPLEEEVRRGGAGRPRGVDGVAAAFAGGDSLPPPPAWPHVCGPSAGWSLGPLRVVSLPVAKPGV